MRRELGLPDGLIVLAGHEAEFWHPGVLAKHMAIVAAAAAMRRGGTAATPVWLTVDHDTHEPWRIAYPKEGPVKAVWKPGPETPEVPLCYRPAIKLTGSAEEIARGLAPGYDFARRGLESI